MANGLRVVILCLVSVALRELYSLFSDPKFQIERLMFPLDSTDISFQTWVDYAAWRAAACVDFFIIRELSQVYFPRYFPEINILFWLSVGYLFDYFVIYNNPFAKFWIIPISYTTFMLILGATTLINAMRKSWT